MPLNKRFKIVERCELTAFEDFHVAYRPFCIFFFIFLYLIYIKSSIHVSKIPTRASVSPDMKYMGFQNLNTNNK